MTDKLDFLEGDKKGKAASQDPKKAVNKKGWVELLSIQSFVRGWVTVDHRCVRPPNPRFTTEIGSHWYFWADLSAWQMWTQTPALQSRMNFPLRYSDSPNAKRKYKDQRFGFGGKKSGKKWNTKESHDDVSGFRAKVAHGRGAKGGKKGKGGKQNVSHVCKLCVCLFNDMFVAVAVNTVSPPRQKRPGKSVRRKMKSRS